MADTGAIEIAIIIIILSHGMAYNASDTSLRSLHTSLVASPLTRFRVPDRRE